MLFVMNNIRKIIHAGLKEASKQSKEFDLEYEKESNRLDQARLDMQERSKSKRLIKPQE